MRISPALAAIAVLTLPISSAAQTTASQTAIDSLKEPIRTRVTCSIQAAKRFDLPANLVIAVAEQEGGHVGQWVQNKNGTYDVGPMQFNTTYLASLERFGITPKDVEADGCYPYELAAWRLRRHLDRDGGDLWRRAANYHSQTPSHNARYRAAIRARAAKWAHWLSKHAPSIQIAHPETPPSPNPPPSPPTHLQSKHLTEAAGVKRRSTRSSGLFPAHISPTPRPTANVNENSQHLPLTETLAALDARRRSKLLELFN